MTFRPSAWLFLALLSAVPAWGGVTYLDLSAAANRGPADPFDNSFPDAQDSVQKNGLASFPVGDQTFRGIPFRLIDPAKNGGRSFVALKGRERPDFPEAVTLKGPGGGVKDLYFLQTCHWGGTAPRITVAEYEVLYADGSGVTIPLHVGREFTNFWGADDTAESYLAWYYRYKNSTMGVNLFAWKNPRPDKAIQSLVFRSRSKMPVPLLFAVTASSGDLPISPISPKPEPPAVTHTMGWMPWTPGPAAPPIDFSGLIEAPAGAHGPVTVKKGDLVFADGAPARFWGTRLPASVFALSQDAMDQLAGRLAAGGFNLAEVGLPDAPAPQTPVPSPAPSSGGLGMLEASLRAEGIYLLVKTPEGQPDFSAPGDAEVVPAGLFDLIQADYNPIPGEAAAPLAFQSQPQLLSMADSLPAQLAADRILPRPALAEWSEGWPQPYLAEAPLLMASMAGFQGWAACVGEGLGQGGDALASGTDWGNPLLGLQEPVAALCFLRGDLKVGHWYAAPAGEGDASTDSAALTVLAHRSGQGASTDPLGMSQAKLQPALKSFTSDSGQVQWQGNIGLYQVDSPRFQAAVGFFSHRRVDESAFEFETADWFGSFSAISLTDKPIAWSDHVLLTAVTRAENSGMVYDAAFDKVMDLGKGPVLLEPFKASVVLFRSKKDPALRLRALGTDGKPLGVAVPFQWKGDNLSFYWVPQASYLELYKQGSK